MVWSSFSTKLVCLEQVPLFGKLNSLLIVQNPLFLTEIPTKIVCFYYRAACRNVNVTGSHINTAALVGQLQNAGHLIVCRGTGTHRVRHLVVCTVEVRTAGMDQPILLTQS